MARSLACLIIPTKNRKKLLLRCLENLQKTGDLGRFEVIVIDDGSSDGTSTAVQHRYSEVTLLRGDGSLHWAGSIARGMQYAHTLDAQYILWLRDDCLPAPDALTQMVKYMTAYGRTFVGATCFSDKPVAIVPTGFKGNHAVKLPPGEDVGVESMWGFCVGFPTIVMDAVGVPDAKNLPTFGADRVFTLRASRSGFRGVMLSNASASLITGYKAPPPLPQYLSQCRHRGFNAVFWDRSSPYDLRTQFHLHYNFYPLFGSVLYLGKVIFWLWHWVWCKKNP